MASRSRPYTRNDPSGRFRPPLTQQQVEAAEATRRALAPVSPSDVVRSDAWYGSQRADDKFPLALVWIGIFALVFIVPWVLTAL